jgi:hypothetical protein
VRVASVSVGIVGILENVEGFSQRHKNSEFSNHSPLDKFVHEIRAIVGHDGQQLYTGIAILHLDMHSWMDVERPRFAPVVVVNFQLGMSTPSKESKECTSSAW